MGCSKGAFTLPVLCSSRSCCCSRFKRLELLLPAILVRSSKNGSPDIINHCAGAGGAAVAQWALKRNFLIGHDLGSRYEYWLSCSLAQSSAMPQMQLPSHPQHEGSSQLLNPPLPQPECTCALQGCRHFGPLPSDPKYTKEERKALRTPSKQLWREVQEALINCSKNRRTVCMRHLFLSS